MWKRNAKAKCESMWKWKKMVSKYVLNKTLVALQRINDKFWWLHKWK